MSVWLAWGYSWFLCYAAETEAPNETSKLFRAERFCDCLVFQTFTLLALKLLAFDETVFPFRLSSRINFLFHYSQEEAISFIERLPEPGLPMEYAAISTAFLGDQVAAGNLLQPQDIECSPRTVRLKLNFFYDSSFHTKS